MTLIRKKKSRLTASVDANGRVIFTVSWSAEDNFELLDFIDKYTDNKKVTRNQAIRDLLYYGKAFAIEKGHNTAI